MLQNIFSLFSRSPIPPLQEHMERVAACMKELQPLFLALKSNNFEEVQNVASKISLLEHAADIKKHEVRNNLPNTMLFNIDRPTFIEMLRAQDSIADTVEDVAVIMTLRPLHYLHAFDKTLSLFIEKNIEAFESVHAIIKELPCLVEASFEGSEAEKVRLMVNKVAIKEHEADVIQRELLRELLDQEHHLTLGSYFQWQKIFEATSRISDYSEKLASSLRVCLEIAS